MYSNLNNYYYRINHEKSFDFFDTSSLAQIKSLLFCELAEADTTSLGNNIKILFNSILKCKNYKDKFELINHISEQYNKYYDDALILYFCQKLSNKKFQMSFTFSKDNITDVAMLLSIGIIKINRDKNKNKTNIKYEKFIESINKYKNMKLNMIPFYKNYTNNNNKNNSLMIQKYDLPNEILLLIDIFQKIKKLIFKINDYSKEIIFGVLLILLNYNWLFPYVFEIELDFNCIDLHKEIDKIYIKKIKDNIGTNNNNTKEKDEDNIINNLDNNKLKNNSNVFDLIIIYTYFIDKFKYLNNLEIKIFDSFKKELENHLNNQKIAIDMPHLLEFFFSINNLNILKIDFNALDSYTFDNIFYLIQNNSNLKHLSLNFFPNEIEFKEFNSLSNLLKLSEESANDIYFLRRKTIKSSNKYNDNKKELQKILLNQLIENFENNMEKLFILLRTKKNLEELNLIFNEPNILLDEENEDYFLVLLKFIYNILIIIDKENLLLKSIKIISKHFKFDNNKNNSINKFLQGINFNEKNKYLINFELQLQINNILYISNIISYNFRKLYLGNLDKISLNNFISFYKNKNFIEKSELFSLTLELNETIISYEKCKNNLIELIKSECPKKMNEIGIFCKFVINKNDLTDLIMNGNGNCVHKYIFKIKGENLDKNSYDKSINDKNIFYIDKNFKNSVSRYMGLIMKYKLHIGKNQKIAKKLFKFLIPNNRKIVDIYFY